MERFAAFVRARDIESARALFRAEVRGFGTRTPEALGLDELIAQQWRLTWMRTRDFRWLPGSMQLQMSRDAGTAIVHARWDSWGVDSDEAWGEQTPYHRQGRCTFALEREPGGQWQCLHSHFSMDPDPRKPA